MTEQVLAPAALFVLFAAVAALGAFLVVANHRGRAAGLLAAALTLIFFGALGAGLANLLSGAGAR
jgi:lipoprotein signal peptidase